MSLVVKNLPANAGDIKDAGLIPGLGRFPGIGNGNSLQYSSLENSMDRGAWWFTVHGVTNSWKWLSMNKESEVAQSCQTLCDPMDTRLHHSWDFLGKSTEVGCHFLLQGTPGNQGSNPGLPNCRQTLYRLSHQGSPSMNKEESYLVDNETPLKI